MIDFFPQTPIFYFRDLCNLRLLNSHTTRILVTVTAPLSESTNVFSIAVEHVGIESVSFMDENASEATLQLYK